MENVLWATEASKDADISRKSTFLPSSFLFESSEINIVDRGEERLNYLKRKRQLANLFNMIMMTVGLVMVTALGSVSIFLIEKYCRPVNEGSVFAECEQWASEQVLDEIKRNATEVTGEDFTTTHNLIVQRTISYLSECVARSTKITDMGDAAIFIWSLFTTVGFGVTYPQTSVGRIFTIVFASGAIPYYVAVKASLGPYIAGPMFKTAEFISDKWAQLKKGKPSDRPSDTLIFFVSLVAFTVSIFINALVIFCAEGWGYIRSLYYTFTTVQLIGLGDVITASTSFFLFCQTIVVLPIDVIGSHINYFLHGKLRVFTMRISHKLVHLVVPPLAATDSENGSQSPSSGGSADELPEDFPAITTTCMPMNMMECDRAEAEKDAELMAQAADTPERRPSVSNKKRASRQTSQQLVAVSVMIPPLVPLEIKEMEIKELEGEDEFSNV